MGLPGIVRMPGEGSPHWSRLHFLSPDLLNLEPLNCLQDGVEVVPDATPSQLDYRDDLAAGELLDVSGADSEPTRHNLEIGQPLRFIDLRLLFLGSHGDGLSDRRLPVRLFEFFLKSHDCSFSSGCEGRMFSVSPGAVARSGVAHFERRSDLIQADKAGQAGIGD
jgi:hypothetical protein